MEILGADFENRHCFECGQTFDCVRNLEFHVEKVLHDPRSIHTPGWPFLHGRFTPSDDLVDATMMSIWTIKI